MLLSEYLHRVLRMPGDAGLRSPKVMFWLFEGRRTDLSSRTLTSICTILFFLFFFKCFLVVRGELGLELSALVAGCKCVTYIPCLSVLLTVFLSLWYYWFSGSTKLSTAARGLPLEIADTWAGSASSPKTSGVWKVCVRAVLLPDLPKRRMHVLTILSGDSVFNYELDMYMIYICIYIQSIPKRLSYPDTYKYI